MFVKICGTTNLPDAELAVDLGADALGFIFAPSKRQVTVEQVAAITRFLPPSVERVGVFTEPDPLEIADTVREAGLTAVQMHWTYDRALVRALRSRLGEQVKLWQVVGYPAEPTLPAGTEAAFTTQLRDALLDRHLAVVLLDSVKNGQSGGQGIPFAWGRAFQAVELARAAVAAQLRGRSDQSTPSLLLAGGLHPENVGEAVRAMLPWGVDVVSGVELGPGRKHPERLKAFIEQAKEAGEDAAWDRRPRQGR